MPSKKTITHAAATLGAFAALVASYRTIKQASVSRKAPEGSPRLPLSVVPKSYDITLSPDLTSCRFTGTVHVHLEVVSKTRFIVLNVAQLDIAENTITLKSENLKKKQVSPISVKVNTADEFLILKFHDVLPLGEAVLNIEYEGTLNDQMKGFYRSTYTLDGEKKNMAVTQFEPADARRCFPCWDEPAFKATFLITLEIPDGLVGLSNMPVEIDMVVGNKRILKFQKSPLMSTYLVAVVVGEFDFIESKTEEGTPVRVYTEKGSQEMGRFALDVAVRTLPFFTKYFGTAYPLPKLDMVAIPDFAAGAMENYGLVTYRSIALLVDPVSTAAANKQRIAVTVTHELAHQWFGNLVTMEWWTHLWLNEGFASWVSYLAVDFLFPDWNVWTQFITNEMSTAFRLDGLQGSHPIEVEVGHVREIDEIFDAISYSKGASVIRMLQCYLGADAFQKGLDSYVKKFAYQNAATEDLWNALSLSTGEPVSELMASWTSQMGYPVVTAKLTENGSLELAQERYLSLGVPGEGEWVIPLTLIQGSYDRKLSSLVRGKTSTVELTDSTSFVKLNVHQAGFYRVQYDAELAKRLVEAIRSGQLDASDRFGLLDDGYALSRAGKQSLADLIRLLQAFESETEFTVLRSVCEIAASTASILADALPDVLPDFQKFAANLIRKKAKELGWEAIAGESHLNEMLRSTLQDTLVSFKDEEAMAEGQKRFHEFVSNKNAAVLGPDLRKAAYRSVLLNVTEEDDSDYEALLKLYRETELSEEKSRILFALGSGPDIVLKKALDLVFTPDVRPQDAIFLLGGLSRTTRDTAWAWLKEKWDEVFTVWGEGFLISRFVSNCSSHFCTEEKAKEIEDFFNSKDCTAVKRTVMQCTERVRATARQVNQVKNEEGLAELIGSLVT